MIKQISFFLLNKIGTTKVLRFQKRDKVTILNLHRVSPERDFFFNPMTPGHFESLLKYVSKNYSVVSISDIFSLTTHHSKSRKPYLVLSFDDGYYDFVEYALPLLVKYKLPSNHNIVNSCANTNEVIWTHRLNNIFNQAKERKHDLQIDIEKRSPHSLPENTKDWMKLYSDTFNKLLNTPYEVRLNWIKEKENELSISLSCRMMNWEEIAECCKFNVEIGSHTYHHDSLATITEYNDLLKEIQGSKIEIESKLKKSIDILALPNGQSNAYIEKVCMEVGISNILLVDNKINNWNIFSANKINLISRINISDESSAEIFLRTEMFHSKIRKYV